MPLIPDHCAFQGGPLDGLIVEVPADGTETVPPTLAPPDVIEMYFRRAGKHGPIDPTLHYMIEASKPWLQHGACGDECREPHRLVTAHLFVAVWSSGIFADHVRLSAYVDPATGERQRPDVDDADTATALQMATDRAMGTLRVN